MLKRLLAVAAFAGCAAVAVSVPSTSTAAAKPAAKPAAKKGDDRAKCYECHDEIKATKEKSKHAKLDCAKCHDKAAEHMENPGQVKPVTNLTPQACGQCHKEQFDSFFEVDYSNPPRKEKGTAMGRSPMQDKLLSPHGFTMEHSEPRGHAFMVVDQFIVDRFAGGRFQLKDGWKIDSTGRTWDIIEDTGKELPLTAKAGNPTCIQCKSSDHVLNWKYLGEKGGKWDRTSNIIDIAKDTQYPVGCIQCHDPHSAAPRVIRDGLIDAISKNPSKNIFSKDGKTDLQIVDFRGFRKIGVMNKVDSRMMCAQCHVEYNCNPGSQWSDGEKVGFNDPRTNHFPLAGPKELLEHYRKLNFFDFKHEVTGARLIKLQHPEAETYAGSVHDKAGVTCADCHMPKVKKGGKTFTAHGVVRPKHDPKASCQGCHPKQSVKQILYGMESTINYTKGKMRKAEYWMGRLIDTYALAKRAGVEESVLAQARGKHEEAHVLWEWWTAENSDGWHNPKLARETLTQSVAASKEGIKLLTDAMAPKKEEPKK